MEALAQGGKTRQGLLAAYLTARRINQAAGGAVVAPWELDDLPDEWIDAAFGLEDVQARQADRARIEAEVERIKREVLGHGS